MGGTRLGIGCARDPNNVAISHLALVAVDPAQLPTFHFFGNSQPNAMYVQILDLTQLTGNPGELPSTIEIDPGMKIYFAGVFANAAFNAKLPVGQTPDTYLQSQFPNQFISDGNVGLSIGGTSTNIVISGIAARPGPGPAPPASAALALLIDEGRLAAGRQDHHAIVVYVHAATGPGAAQRLADEYRRWGYADRPEDLGVAGDAAAVAEAVRGGRRPAPARLCSSPRPTTPTPEAFVRFVAEEVRPLLNP